MKTNVGNNVQDTSPALATKIGVWLNDAHSDAAQRFNWASLTDDDYTFESVADQALYTLPTDFIEELILFNINQGYELKRQTLGNRWRDKGYDYKSDVIASGTPGSYTILPESGELRLDPPPLEAETYALPYRKDVADLTDSDTPTILEKGIDRFMELYATGQALVYKRRIADGDWYLNRSEFELRKIIHQAQTKVNQRYQFVPQKRDSGKINRLTGDLSYDSI